MNKDKTYLIMLIVLFIGSFFIKELLNIFAFVLGLYLAKLERLI